MKITQKQAKEVMEKGIVYSIQLEVVFPNKVVKFDLEYSDFNGLDYYESNSNDAEFEYRNKFETAMDLVENGQNFILIEYKE